MSASRCLGELYQWQSGLDQFSLGAADRRDETVGVRAHRQLHLHRFEDDQRVAAPDGIAGAHEDLPNGCRHGS